MTVIESNEYREVVDRLVADPILQDMLVGLRDVPDERIMHDDGTPRFAFMGDANERYGKAGGRLGGHLGAVAQAVIRIRQERGRCHVPAYLEPLLVYIDAGDRLKLLLENEELTLMGVRQHHPSGWAQFELLRRLWEGRQLVRSLDG